MEVPTPHSTLAEAAAWTRAQMEAAGGECPCCHRFGKVYRRSLTISMAKALVEFYRHRDRKGGFIHYSKALPPALRSDYGKLRFWGLLEAQFNDDPAKKDSGLWRITVNGKGWLKGYHKVPKTAVIYDDRLVRLEGPDIVVPESLRTDFNYQALMADEIRHQTTQDDLQLNLLGGGVHAPA